MVVCVDGRGWRQKKDDDAEPGPDFLRSATTTTPLWVEDRRTLVYVTDLPRLSGAQVRQLGEWLPRRGCRALVLVNRVAMAGTTTSTITVVPWSVVLMYPLDHELVPHHQRATAEERARHAPVRAHLPVLRSDDPIAVYLGLRSPDVVRIDRRDGTVYWRQVVGPH